MKIECPHCSQSIDLGDEPPPSFVCPTCDGHIQLQVKAEAAKPARIPSTQGIKLPVLIGSIAGAIVLTLLVGWMTWGNNSERIGPEAEDTVNSEPIQKDDSDHGKIPVSDSIVGTWVYIGDETPILYFTFADDGTFESGIVDDLSGKEEYSFFEGGIYRVVGDSLQIGTGSINGVAGSRPEWGTLQKFSIRNNVLTVFPLPGKTEADKYKRVAR
ncbi:MAG: hypothetical protein ABJQ29_15545 [Luteolibacter sp.]